MKHVLFEAIGQVDDGYLTRAEKLLEAPRSTGRKLWTVALAAAVCASILAATAVATGWKTGIFRELESQESTDQALFQAAADANTEAAPEFAPIPELDLSRFVLLERYFDGNTILLGYDMEVLLPRPAVGVEVDEQTLNDIRHGSPISSMVWSGGRTQTDGRGKAKQHDLAQNGYLLDEDLHTILTQEEYDAMWAILEREGYVVLAAWNPSVGDHILVDGQELPEPWTTEYGTQAGICRRLDSLPDSVRDADSVTVTLTLRAGLWYYYLDLEGNAFLYCHHTDSREASFVMERSEAK